MHQSQSNSISNAHQNIFMHSQDPGGSIGFPSSFVFPGAGVGFFTHPPSLLMCPQLGVTEEEFGQLGAAHALMVMSSGSGLEQDLDLDFWAFHIQQAIAKEQDARRQQLSNANLCNAAILQSPAAEAANKLGGGVLLPFLLPEASKTSLEPFATIDHCHQDHHLFDGMDWMLEEDVVAEDCSQQEEHDERAERELSSSASELSSSSSISSSKSSSCSASSSRSAHSATNAKMLLSSSCSSMINKNNNVTIQNLEDESLEKGLEEKKGLNEEEEELLEEDGLLEDLDQFIMDSFGAPGEEANGEADEEEKAKLGPWRQQYLAQMSSAYSQKRIQPRNMLSRKRYDTLVERLKRTEELERSAQLPGHIVKISQKYRMIRFNMSDKGKKSKTLEMLAEQRKNRLFLCVDQLFDVLYKLHMNTRHGRSISMYSAARKKFANITVESILKFLEGCEDCKKWNKNEKKLNTLLKPNWNKDKKIHYEHFFDFDERVQLIQCHFCPYKKATAEGQKCTNALRSHLKKHHPDMLRQSRSQQEEEE